MTEKVEGIDFEYDEVGIRWSIGTGIVDSKKPRKIFGYCGGANQITIL